MGVAAHISAAAAGGVRYDPALTAEQRTSRENGIWLCQTHAKQIDDDATRYPKELLYAWKIAAEDRAREAQGRPTLKDAGGSRRLVPFLTVVRGPRARLQEEVARFLVDVGGPAAWGHHYDSVRMAVYELALNAIEHGAAPEVELESKSGVIAVRDSGRRFGLEQLRAGGRGGRQAISDLTSSTVGTFSVVYMARSDRNEWFIVDQVVNDGANTPCAMVVPGTGFVAAANAERELARLDTCDDIHMYPGRLWSYSDYYLVIDRVRGRLGDRLFVIHGVHRDSPLGTWLVTLSPRISLPD